MLPLAAVIRSISNLREERKQFGQNGALSDAFFVAIR